MKESQFLEKEHELKQSDYIVDSRPPFERMLDWCALPRNHAKMMLWYALAAVVFAPVWQLVFVLAFAHNFFYSFTPKYAAFRYPKDLGGKDPSVIKDPQNPAWGDAEGIYYCGYERSRFPWKKGRELWLTSDDIGTHNVSMGTTGAGKTQHLLSQQVFNALCWGSGCLFSDGKADNDLMIKIWALCRRFGREHDFLVINYLTGGFDPFTNTVRTEKRLTNKANMFSEAPMDFLSELLTSMLPKVQGEGAGWQQKAINMMKAVVRIACYFRAKGQVEVSVTQLREFMTIQQLIKIYRHSEAFPHLYDPNAISAVKSYLLTGISWNPSTTAEKDRWKLGPLEAGDFMEKISTEAQTQHGYLTNQFLAPLSMLADTYGSIFRDPFPEVDMADVFLRRRILAIAIPTLEKSPQEAANLGKLLIGSLKLMLGKNLGNELEGYYTQLIENKATNSRTRFPIVLDEAAYYFSPGLDIIFAQSRSLGGALTISGQDIYAMEKEGADEIYSVIGNSKVKICLALEDPNKTFEVFQKSASDAKISQSQGASVVGSNMNGGIWQRSNQVSVADTARIKFDEVKNLKSGQGIAIFMGSVVRFDSFYTFKDISPKTVVRYKLNKFLQVAKPKIDDFRDKCKPLHPKRNKSDIDVIFENMVMGERPFYQMEHTPIFDMLCTVENHLDNEQEDGQQAGIFALSAALLNVTDDKQVEPGAKSHQTAATPINTDPAAIDLSDPASSALLNEIRNKVHQSLKEKKGFLQGSELSKFPQIVSSAWIADGIKSAYGEQQGSEFFGLDEFQIIKKIGTFDEQKLCATLGLDPQSPGSDYITKCASKVAGTMAEADLQQSLKETFVIEDAMSFEEIYAEGFSLGGPTLPIQEVPERMPSLVLAGPSIQRVASIEKMLCADEADANRAVRNVEENISRISSLMEGKQDERATVFRSKFESLDKDVDTFFKEALDEIEEKIKISETA